MAAAELATSDLPASRILAGRLPLPEARLLAELFVAHRVLDDAPTAQGGAASGGRFVTYIQ